MSNLDRVLCVQAGSSGRFTFKKTYDVVDVHVTRSRHEVLFRKFTIMSDDDTASEFYDDEDLDQSQEVIRHFSNFDYFMNISGMTDEDIFQHMLSN